MRSIILFIIVTFGCLAVQGQISLNLKPDIVCLCGEEATNPFDLNAVGSAEPFEFNWNGPNDYYSWLKNPTIFSPGLYTVTVTNAYGCETILEAELPSCPVINFLQLDVVTNCGSGGGNATAIATGGTGTLSYLWSNGVGGPNLENVPAGTYSVTITDDNECSIIEEVDIPEPPTEPIFEVIGEVTSDCNPNGGSIILDMEGIAEPYEIQWSLPGATEYRIQNLTNGSYQVTVTDANGCSNEGEFLVYGAPVYEYEVENASCNDSNDGRIELIESSGGSAQPVTIAWSDGLGANQLIRENMPAGEYWVAIVGEESGCGVGIQNISIEPDPNQAAYPYLTNLKIIASNNSTNTVIYNGSWIETTAGCFEYMDLSQNLDLALVNAMGNGEFKWDVYATFSSPVEGALIVISSQDFNPAYTLDELNSTIFTSSISNSQVAMLVGNQGSFELMTNVVALTEDGIPNLNMLTLSNDLNDCVVIPELDPVSCTYVPSVMPDDAGSDQTHSFSFRCAELSLEPSNGNTFCLNIGDTDFSEVTAMQIKKPQSNTWENINPPSDCFEVSPNLYGEYCVRIRIGDDCVARACATYCEEVSYNLHSDVTYPSCNGADDGAISVQFDTNPEDVSFLLQWTSYEDPDFESTGEMINNLEVGAYTLTLSPTNGCGLMTISPANEISFDLLVDSENITSQTSITPACAEENNGEICLNLSGGTEPYTVIWADGPTGNCLSNIVVGTYHYTVIDGCSAVTSGQVEVPPFSAQNDVSVEFLEQGDDDCGPELGLIISSPLEVTVTIIHSLDYTFVQQGNGGMLFQNIPSGNYQVLIEDDCGGELILEHTVEDRQVSIIKGVDDHGGISCKGGSGMLTLELTEEGTAPYTVEWSTGESSLTIDGLSDGIYSVIVTDFNGCSEEIYVLLDFGNILGFEEMITGPCDGGLGAIELNISGGAPPYSFAWRTGETSQDLTNLEPGEYCVTISDMEDCEVDACFTIEETIELLGSNIKNHDCTSSTCTGNIELELLNAENATFLWSNGATTQNLLNVCNGEYSVTITSGQCMEEATFVVETDGAVMDWDYDYRIISGFYNNTATSAQAEVFLYSRLFDDFWIPESTISLYTDAGFSELVDANINFGALLGDRRIRIRIPEMYSPVETFYFKFIASNGCEYRGEIIVKTCGEESSQFNFTPIHQGNELQACELGQSNTYLLNITEIGNDFPYYISVQMGHNSGPQTATFPEEEDFRETVVIEEGFNILTDNPIEITGIPSGYVSFVGTTGCGYKLIRFHDNCCIFPVCELQDEREFERSGLSSYEYIYQFLGINTIGSGDCFEQGESNVIINRPYGFVNGFKTESSYTVDNVCWTGTIEITVVGEYLTAPFTITTLDVSPDQDDENAHRVNIEGDNNWKPEAAGTYQITMSYTGSGESTGLDCEDVLPVNFYDNNVNGGDLIGTRTGLWWNYLDSSIPDAFEDAHVSSYSCKVCRPSGEYAIGDNNAEACDGGVNSILSYFNFFPDEYNEDPCNGGGWLVIIDYDDDGSAELTSTYIFPNTAIADLDRLRAFHGPSSEDPEIVCRAGWCLFNSIDVYGFEFEDGKPILGTWYDPEACANLPAVDSGIPNAPPCSTENCPEPFICHQGNCVEPCSIDDDCFPGVCDGTGCVEEIIEPGNECPDGICPDGQVCDENGYCVDEVFGCTSGLITSYLQCGSNPCNFSFESNGPAILRIEFRTYGLGRITITVDGEDNPQSCIQTAGGIEWIEYEIPVQGDALVQILVESAGCGEPALTQFDWTAWCGTHHGIDDDEDTNFLIGDNDLANGVEAGYNEMFVYPNPFLSTLSIEANVSESFLGDVVVMDYQGTERMRQSFQFVEGYNSLDMEGISSLNEGMYVIAIVKNGVVTAARTVVKM